MIRPTIKIVMKLPSEKSIKNLRLVSIMLVEIMSDIFMTTTTRGKSRA